MPNEVDKVIHPHPTGAAALLAKKHAAPASSGFTLYSGWFCPFAQRAWITLEELSLPYTYIEINPYHKETHFLALNPRGLVPTLAITDSPPQPTNGTTTETEAGIARADVSTKSQKVLYESLVICDYLDAITATSPLYSQDAFTKARAKIWIDHISTRIVPCFYRFLQHTSDKAYSLASVRDEFVTKIKEWASELSTDGGDGPWFLGSRFSMVDLALAPWACRIFLLDHYKGGSGVPGPGTEGNDEVWRRWRRWFAAIVERDSVVNTLSDAERYVAVYQRYSEDTTGSGVGEATRGGRGLP